MSYIQSISRIRYFLGALKNQVSRFPFFCSFIVLVVVVLTYCRLKKLGALEKDLVVYENESWRFLSCMFLHAGVVHLLANMFSLLFIGVRQEKESGFRKHFTVFAR